MAASRRDRVIENVFGRPAERLEPLGYTRRAGGGAAFDDGSQAGDAILNSYPSDTNGSRLSTGSQPSGWAASAYNSAGTSRSFTVYAVCSP